jgi:hypothetical protein
MPFLYLSEIITGLHLSGIAAIIGEIGGKPPWKAKNKQPMQHSLAQSPKVA